MENSELSFWPYFFFLSFMDHCNVLFLDVIENLAYQNCGSVSEQCNYNCLKSYICGLQIAYILPPTFREHV